MSDAKKSCRFLLPPALCLLVLLNGCIGARPRIETPAPQQEAPAAGQGQQGRSASSVPPESTRTVPLGILPGAAGEGGLAAGDLLPDKGYIRQRKELYQAREREWKELMASFTLYDYPVPDKKRVEQCVALTGGLAAGYKSLQEMAERSAVVQKKDAPTLFAVFRQDIAFFEKECSSVYKTVHEALPGHLDQYRETVHQQGEEALRYLEQTNDPAAVISAYENMVAAGASDVGREAKKIYAKALQRSGRLEEAAAVLLDVADSAGPIDGAPLRLEAGDLLFATGNYGEASRHYQAVASLVDGLKNFEARAGKKLELLAGQGEHGREIEQYRLALAAWLRYGGGELPADLVEGVRLLEGEFPESPYAAAARELVNGLTAKAADRATQALDQARQLADEKKFDAALGVLTPLPQGVLDQEQATMVREVAEQIRARAAEEEANRESVRLQGLEQKWDEAMGLLDQLRFDEAIVLFTELSATEEYGRDANEKIAEAANLAAAELRKEAAALFVKARNENNPGQKERLLQQSRQLLSHILEQYPRAEITAKVKQNLLAIDEQLQKLQPAVPQ